MNSINFNDTYVNGINFNDNKQKDELITKKRNIAVFFLAAFRKNRSEERRVGKEC